MSGSGHDRLVINKVVIGGQRTFH